MPMRSWNAVIKIFAYYSSLLDGFFVQCGVAVGCVVGFGLFGCLWLGFEWRVAELACGRIYSPLI